MTTVGIYVDGPNMERGLYTSGDYAVLERVGSLLMEHAQMIGEVTEAKVFLDEATMWRSSKTREDYELNGFYFQESKSFKRVDNKTGAFSFGKSLTDPSMHCALVDRLHDPDCPDVMTAWVGRIRPHRYRWAGRCLSSSTTTETKGCRSKVTPSRSRVKHTVEAAGDEDRSRRPYFPRWLTYTTDV